MNGGFAGGASNLKPGPWRVFLSHTSELREYPSGGSYISKAERAVSAAGHAIGNMADFAASDQAPANVCTKRVKGSDVYIGIYGLRYGSPVRDQPDISYTELEFNTATAMGIPRLVFLLDDDSEDHGLPVKALRDPDFGHRQVVFLQRVKDACLTTKRFSNPHDLKGLVERSLRNLASGHIDSTQLSRENFIDKKSAICSGELSAPRGLGNLESPLGDQPPMALPSTSLQEKRSGVVTSSRLYDAKYDWKVSDFLGQRGQKWDDEQRKHIGDFGEGSIEYLSDGLLRIHRFNRFGRYDIELKRYNVNNKNFEYILPMKGISTRRLVASFEARSLDASFTCDFLFKIYPNGRVEGVKTLVIDAGETWETFTLPFYLDCHECYTFRIYNTKVSCAPSEMQIRNLSIEDESF